MATRITYLLFSQAIETDRILGADKFTLYLHSASPEVLAIIRHYVTSGVMEAIEWRLPFTDASLVHYFGQLAAINDCLYSYQYTSRYVVFHDFDELLLPRMHDTWNEMLEAIQLQVSHSWLGCLCRWLFFFFFFFFWFFCFFFALIRPCRLTGRKAPSDLLTYSSFSVQWLTLTF